MGGRIPTIVMSEPDFHLHFLLHSAGLVEDHLRTRLAELGIRPRQARVIDALGRMGSASQADLTREFGGKAASMSTMTARFVDGGYIKRDPNPGEARSNLLGLTKKGRELLSAIHDAWCDVDRLVEEKVGIDGLSRLGELTGELRDALGGPVSGSTQILHNSMQKEHSS